MEKQHWLQRLPGHFKQTDQWLQESMATILSASSTAYTSLWPMLNDFPELALCVPVCPLQQNNAAHTCASKVTGSNTPPHLMCSLSFRPCRH